MSVSSSDHRGMPGAGHSNPRQSGKVCSSLIETSCLTDGKAPISSPERPFTRQRLEFVAKRQQKSPLPRERLGPFTRCDDCYNCGWL